MSLCENCQESLWESLHVLFGDGTELIGHGCRKCHIWETEKVVAHNVNSGGDGVSEQDKLEAAKALFG